jgi:hypothetical protein
MADSQDVTHQMRRSGAADGQVTGDHYRFARGDEIEAPEGELAHLPRGTYQTRPVEAGRAGGSPPELVPGPYTLGPHVGGGYYEIRRDGEAVTEDNGDLIKAGQGKDEAVRMVNDLNREGRE